MPPTPAAEDATVQFEMEDIVIKPRQTPVIRGHFLALWEMVVVVTTILSTMLVIFQIANKASLIEITILSYIFDIIYAINIGVQFYVPYLEEGRLVYDSRSIKRKYLQGGFIIDIISVLPIEVVILVTLDDFNAWEYANRIQKITRILRFYMVIYFIQKYKAHTRNKEVSNETRLKLNGLYEHLWHRHQGTLEDNNEHSLETAPLSRDISMEFMRMATSKSLNSVPTLPICLAIVFTTLLFILRDGRYIYAGSIIWVSPFLLILFICLYAGTVEVMSSHEDVTPFRPIRILQEGIFFGELTLLLNIPRAVTCRASAYCELLLLERTDLSKVLNHFPEVGQSLYETMAKRCQDADKYIQRKDKSHFQVSDYHNIQ